MAHVVEINRIEELRKYQLVWDALLQKTRGGSFFQSLDWLTTYWKFYGQDQKLRVLIVFSGGSPIGIMPLVVRQEKNRLGQVKVLTYPLHDWGTFYGPIGPNPTATLATAMQYLRCSSRDWETLDLRWINRDGHDHGRTRDAMAMAGMNVCQSVWKETAIVDTSTSWEEYFASRTTKFRNNVRRHQKRTAKLGDIEFERYRPLGAAHGDDDPRWELYDACVELSKRSWQGSSQTGTTLAHESVRGFFRAAHALAAKAGALDLNVIKLDGRLIAFAYNYHSDGHVTGMRIGYDPQFAKAGLGNALYREIIADSCRRDDHTFDLGPGSLAIKRDWLTHHAHSYRCTHYAPAAPRAQLLRVKHWLCRRRESGRTQEKQPAAGV